MTQNVSPAQLLASLPEELRKAHLARLSTEVKAYLAYHWPFWARPNQLPPLKTEAGLDWFTWVVLAGRGFGKTRCGSEWVRSLACGKTPLAAGTHHRFALVAETAADARDVIVEGDSGILAVHPKAFRPNYEPSKRRLTWPNGAIATLYNGTEPDQLRGPQHDAAWVDELAKFDYARETWDMLQFGLRLGHPRQMVTTTPRPIPLLKEIIKDPTTAITKGATYDNADNLAGAFLKQIKTKYEGTRLGRQELNAEILDDLPGALWTREMIDALRRKVKDVPDLVRIVVSVDPSGTKGESDDGDDIGIVVAGKGVDGRGYVFADMTCKLSPDGWGRRAVAAFNGSWVREELGMNPEDYKADRIIGERNYGGAMVEHVIKTVDSKVPYKEVIASRGKVVRAEPVAALYEQGRVSHVGSFNDLEDQMCLMAPDGYAGEGSPDRCDALVWALTELLVDGSTYTLANVG
jgi:phage terminase large subunit-like protein